MCCKKCRLPSPRAKKAATSEGLTPIERRDVSFLMSPFSGFRLNTSVFLKKQTLSPASPRQKSCDPGGSSIGTVAVRMAVSIRLIHSVPFCSSTTARRSSPSQQSSLTGNGVVTEKQDTPSVLKKSTALPCGIAAMASPTTCVLLQAGTPCSGFIWIS